jgi:hypothetical protein
MTTYRFKLAEPIMAIITQFAQTHQYDDRKIYKEAWLRWLNNNHGLVEEEIKRLIQEGYPGDVADKMFKAGRYYFRKKPVLEKVEAPTAVVQVPTAVVQVPTAVVQVPTAVVQVPTAVVPTAARKKRLYISMDPAILKAMDQHIQQHHMLAPASGFNDFCLKQAVLLQGEINRLMEEEYTLVVQKEKEMEMEKEMEKEKEKEKKLYLKVKKTYKNRYFIFTMKN